MAQPPERRARPECHVHLLGLQHSAQQRLDVDGVTDSDTHVLLGYLTQANLASRKPGHRPGRVHLPRTQEEKNTRKLLSVINS